MNQRSADKARPRGDPETIANAELNLGDIFLAQGALSRARDIFDSVFHVAHDPNTSDWMKWRYSMHLFASLGELWLARREPVTAQKFTEQCLAIAIRTNSRKYLVKGWRLKGEIALFHRQWEETQRWLQQALVIAEEVGNPTQLWKTHFALGRLHTAMNQPDKARQRYQAAREVVDRMKAHVQHPELRRGLETSSVFQEVYEMSACDW